ncbi:packaged DNA stabilization gp4 family protein [Franconibacter sp. IITDAS19]|uniref:packaged DNA stabilization gp4 family protein n=1 Tax=Franconibacter sp. IITDAS19 TaxID=2930569 RepID=UPI001FFA983E|nr:packaged DNA stabilization gp4 family protein [Franconibacter sp. IITDAS19]MCK1966868.1 packaged DNA stabilization gp4 family protein [Franconibacter sp. IITDAS19]
MNIKTKGDLVNTALRKLGVASDATLTDVEPQSVEDAVLDLEMMMSEWYQDGAGIDAGYSFATDEPPMDGDEHGMKPSAVSAVVHNLAIRIAPDYEIEPSAKIVTTARYGKELLYKVTALKRAEKAGAMGYPNRMPVGSGNRCATLSSWNYFHRRDNKDADSSTPPDEGNG